MSVLPVGFASASGVDVGDIGHSVRLRRSASAYFSKTLAAPTNNKKWTWSGWVKRSEIGVAHGLFDRYVGSVDFSSLYISSDNRIYFYTVVTGPVDYSVETAVNSFRDTTGHVNVTFVFDSDNAVQADRAIIYISGVRQTVTNTYGAIPSGHTTYLNTAAAHSLGRLVDNSRYMDGYLSRVCFVDGQALDPTAFGYFNTTINEWVSKTQAQVKAVVDAGGTNSFMLDFDDPNFATYNVGKDFSSKNNHWTPTNISLTAGSTYDWMLDAPGNSFATLNPIYPSAANITNGNLTSGTTAVRGTMNALAYDCKWEVTAGGSAVTAGVISGTGTTNTTSVTANKTFAFRLTTAGALDYKNVTDAGSWTSITTGLTGEQYPYGITQAANWNFGQAPLHASATYQVAAGGYFYDTTSGLKALCQANLPDPAIKNPELHHNVVLATGANIKTTSEAVYPSNFLEWIKDRANSNNHQLIDTVRGSSAVLQSNTTAAETTYTAPSGNSVGWAWKAGGAAVTNNAGSISSQVSANTTAGFSIVTATLTATNQTIGHGVGAVPKFIVGFKRNGTSSHPCYHSGLSSAANVVYLDTTAAQAASATTWNSTAPTSTVFSVGTGLTGDWVFYCFAEIPGYSKIGSYTGNGSADGPYVECGFKPKFVMVKRSDSTGSWQMFDSLRAGYNVDNDQLVANTSAAEVTTDLLDLTSSSFKVRSTSIEVNASGGTYIFIAFADVAGKYSLGR